MLKAIAFGYRGALAVIGLIILGFFPARSHADSQSAPLTEQRWIIESIVRDIADIAVYAGDKKDAPLPAAAVSIESEVLNPSGFHYQIAIHLPSDPHPILHTLDITGPVWSPAAYRPIAQALLDRFNLTKPDPVKSTANPLVALISPTTDEIQRQNKTVSQLLTDHPLSADAHEQAALVVGVLGMRENSGIFWDSRPMCNRAVAHLAFAAALRGDQPQSEAGEVAELLVGLLDDTKEICERQISHLKDESKTDSGLHPWIIAAQLRNRRDWRVLDNPTGASLLERIEYFRARCESVSSDAAANDLAHEPENVADWYSIILQFRFSVDSGHRFTDSGLRREFYEATRVFPMLQASPPAPGALAAALNQNPGDAVQRDASGALVILPIDDGMWAHFFQRHLLHIVYRTDYFLRKAWNVPDEAAAFESAIGRLFSKLTFNPLLEVAWSGLNDSVPDVDAAARLVAAHPEWVNADAWAKIPSGATGSAPGMAAWFSPALPAGTAYCYYGRDECIPELKDLSVDGLAKLYAIAPWHYGIVEAYMKARYGDTPTPEQFRSLMGPFLEFNVHAMLAYLECIPDNVPETVSTYKRLAVLDPFYYLDLGKFYRAHKMDEDAAKAIQAAIDNGADPVAVTYSSGWLVSYYYDHGQKDRALAVAKDAAEVYSEPGLETMAMLQERMGNLDEAESYYKKIKERYDKPLPLLAFYGRQQSAKLATDYAAKLQANIGSLFPGGVKSVTLADFTAPPTKGVIIDGENDLLRQSGLKKGDIIVALDGKKVETFPQYCFLRDQNKSPIMDFIVFEAGKYRSVKASVPNRRFNLQFRSWPISPPVE